jgi:hypothetical protein
LSASADGESFSFSKRLKTKLSMGFFIHAFCCTSGIADFSGLIKAQCGLYSAPCSIHLINTAFS